MADIPIRTFVLDRNSRILGQSFMPDFIRLLYGNVLCHFLIAGFNKM